jgi:hypothetical protein
MPEGPTAHLDGRRLSRRQRYPQRAGGEFRRRLGLQCNNARRHPGKEAGYKSDRGSWRITVDGQSFYRSRLAWLYQTGSWPPPGMEVDHIDRDAGNDAWSNLRLAEKWQNVANRDLKPGRSGVIGVHRRAARRRSSWRARINANRWAINLGSFKTKAEAVAAPARWRAPMADHAGRVAARARARARAGCAAW